MAKDSLMTVRFSTYFFDCLETKNWCDLALSLEPSQSHYLPEFVFQATGMTPTSAAEKLNFICKSLPEADKASAAQFLATMERLRETFILLPEHVEHCFEQLPPSPKNAILKNCLLRFFESQHKDWVFAAWELIALLKSGARPELEPEPELDQVFFIKSLKPSLILEELATAWSYRAQAHAVRVVNAANLGDLLPTTYVSGNLSERMIRLCDEAAILTQEGKRKILIPFCGDSALKGTLEIALASRGIDRAFIGPFIIPPAIHNTAVLAFLCDEPLAQFESELCLSDEECFELVRQGFPLPNYRDYKSQVLDQCHLAPRLFGPADIAKALNLVCGSYPIAAMPLERPRIEVPLPAVKRTLSATGLENYAKCPSVYFFSNVLKLRKPTLLDDDSFALILGQTIHATLERFFQKHADYEQLVPLFLEVLTEEFKELGASTPVYSRLVTAASRMLANVAKLEATLVALFGNSKRIRFEEPFDGEFDGIPLRGKIDRIDQIGSGSSLLLDYKTGTIDFSPKSILAGTHFQALVYLLAMQTQETAGFLFYDLKKGELRRGLLKEDAVSPEAKKAITQGHTLNSEKWESLMRTGKEHLKRIYHAVQLGQFEPSPEASHCERCSFIPHCRKAYDHH